MTKIFHLSFDSNLYEKNKKFGKNQTPKARYFIETLFHKARWGYAIEVYGGLVPGQHEAAIHKVCEITGYSRSTLESYWAYYRNQFDDAAKEKFKPTFEVMLEKFLIEKAGE